MSTNNILALVAAGIIIIGGYLYYNTPAQTPAPAANPVTQQAPAPVAPATDTPAVPAAVKFADQDYAKSAYLIDPANIAKMDAKTKLAISGFKIAPTKNADGSYTVAFTSTNKEYTNQTVTVRADDKLYFIEKNLMDDKQGTDEDKYVQDDMVIVVDKDGNVVQQ